MVVEVGGFAKAGDLLGLSQPAVSLQIKRLEDVLGYKLFKKQGQRQVLKPVRRAITAYGKTDDATQRCYFAAVHLRKHCR